MGEATDIRPRGFFTRWYASADGQKLALCTYHLRCRQTVGEELEPLHEDIKDDDCGDACADCKERQRAKGDAYALPLRDHWESLAINSDVIWYAIEDMLSTLEICADLMKERDHVAVIEKDQAALRKAVDLFDTSLNEAYSIAPRLSSMLDDEGNEIIRGDDDDADS